MLAQIVTAPKLQTAVLKYEVNPEFCREQGVLLAGSGAVRDIEIGRVLGKITSGAGSGKIVAFDADATDGSEEPYGIAIAPAAAKDGVDGAVLMLVRGPAIVYGPELVWPAGISDAGKATAIAQLAAKGIVVRNA